MKVDDLILDLQNLVDNARPVPLSGGKVMVNSDEAFEIIAQIQDAMPAEVRQAKNIVARRTLSALPRSARRSCLTRTSLSARRRLRLRRS